MTDSIRTALERLVELEVTDPAFIAAATLRAAADQVVPDTEPIDSEEWPGQSVWEQAQYSTRFRLLAIATELEGGKWLKEAE